jgi:hypothetical protein
MDHGRICNDAKKKKKNYNYRKINKYLFPRRHGKTSKQKEEENNTHIHTQGKNAKNTYAHQSKHATKGSQVKRSPTREVDDNPTEIEQEGHQLDLHMEGDVYVDYTYTYTYKHTHTHT